VFSFFAFVVIGSLILLTAAAVALRLWWFRRQLQKGQARDRGQHDAPRADGVIEGEFRVVSDPGKRRDRQ